MVWLHQGLWCKVLDRSAHQAAIMEASPLWNPRVVSFGIGGLECAIAVWVLSGLHLRRAAVAQTVLLAGMNAAGLVWAAKLIPDPAGMLLQNAAFLTLAWVVAAKERT
jgi:hypothetical protein